MAILHATPTYKITAISNKEHIIQLTDQITGDGTGGTVTLGPYYMISSLKYILSNKFTYYFKHILPYTSDSNNTLCTFKIYSTTKPLFNLLPHDPSNYNIYHTFPQPMNNYESNFNKILGKPDTENVAGYFSIKWPTNTNLETYQVDILLYGILK